MVGRFVISASAFYNLEKVFLKVINRAGRNVKSASRASERMKAEYTPKLTFGIKEATIKIPNEATSTMVVVTRAGAV